MVAEFSFEVLADGEPSGGGVVGEVDLSSSMMTTSASSDGLIFSSLDLFSGTSSDSSGFLFGVPEEKNLEASFTAKVVPGVSEDALSEDF